MSSFIDIFRRPSARNTGRATAPAAPATPQMSHFLSLPLELRLLIYNLLIGPSQCQQTPTPYFSFVFLDTGNPSALTFCRSGFRKWNYRRTPVWQNWPRHDTTALYLTCHQINFELREEFHPGPVTLKIMDDVFFNLCAGERLYKAIDERSWLFQRLEIVRLDLTAWNEHPECWPYLRSCKMHQNARFAIEHGDARREEVQWVNRARRLMRQIRTRGVLSFDELHESWHGKHNFAKLAAYLKTLPNLKKIEFFIRATEVLERWTDPFGDLKALQNVGVPLSVVLGAPVSMGALKDMVESHKGKIDVLVSRSMVGLWAMHLWYTYPRRYQEFGEKQNILRIVSQTGDVDLRLLSE